MIDKILNWIDIQLDKYRAYRIHKTECQNCLILQDVINKLELANARMLDKLLVSGNIKLDSVPLVSDEEVEELTPLKKGLSNGRNMAARKMHESFIRNQNNIEEYESSIENK